MNKILNIIIFFFFSLTVSYVHAQERMESNTLADLRTIHQSAFALGERLVYDIGYSFITAGEAVFSIPSVETMHGRECYQVLFTVNSTRTFSFFY